MPSYLDALGKQLEDQQSRALEDVDGLMKNVEHIKEIVAMQQTYTRVAGLAEIISLPELTDSALKMETGGFARHNINVVREYEEVPPISADKHRILQILINLLHNAKYACDESQRADKCVRVAVKAMDGRRMRIEVADNGIGIAPENRKRIFTHGFTTRKNGHGFGLHSSVLAARELGGTLSFHSDGLGKGAVFTLEIPCEPKELSRDPL